MAHGVLQATNVGAMHWLCTSLQSSSLCSCPFLGSHNLGNNGRWVWSVSTQPLDV